MLRRTVVANRNWQLAQPHRGDPLPDVPGAGQYGDHPVLRCQLCLGEEDPSQLLQVWIIGAGLVARERAGEAPSCGHAGVDLLPREVVVQKDQNLPTLGYSSDGPVAHGREPTSRTQPAFSCPMTNGSSTGALPCHCPSRMCRSVRQSPAPG